MSCLGDFKHAGQAGSRSFEGMLLPFDGRFSTLGECIRSLSAFDHLKIGRAQSLWRGLPEGMVVKEGSAMGVVVEPSARETFTPRELAAAYKEFLERGPQYLDEETGITASAYRFGERVLLVYEESETGLVVLIHPLATRRG